MKSSKEMAPLTLLICFWLFLISATFLCVLTNRYHSNAWLSIAKPEDIPLLGKIALYLGYWTSAIFGVIGIYSIIIFRKFKKTEEYNYYTIRLFSLVLIAIAIVLIVVGCEYDVNYRIWEAFSRKKH